MDVIEQIKRDGQKYNLCRLYQSKLKPDLTVEDLAELYFKGIDFCIMNNYPTVQFMKDNFKGKCEQYGIFVEDRSVNANNLSKVVMIGDCKGQLSYDGFSVSRVFVRHTSETKILVSEYAHVSVDIFDSANVTIVVAGTKAKVLVNIYGEDANVSCSSGLVKVRKKKSF